MLTFIFLFFLAVVGIGTYLIAVKAKRRTPAEKTPPVPAPPRVGRAVGSGDD